MGCGASSATGGNKAAAAREQAPTLHAMHDQLRAVGAPVSENTEEAPAPAPAPAPAEPEAAAAAEAPAPAPTVEGTFKVVVFSSRAYEEELFLEAAKKLLAEKGMHVEIDLLEVPLNVRTAQLAEHANAVCAFVNDDVGAKTLEYLRNSTDVRLVLMRCAGFNNVDLAVAARCEITVARVPEYSPYAVAEHSVALAMTLNRKTHKAYLRNRDYNFSLNGLLGFDFRGKTVGIVGTGKIGIAAANIYLGFGCKVVAQSRSARPELVEKGVEYMSLEELCKVCDIISLHAPLTKGTRYCINSETIELMKDGVMIINTSRGALLDTEAAIEGLKSRKIGALGIDVYEHEAGLFFNDHTGEILDDDLIVKLVNYPNVIVTGHQAFLTREAIQSICEQTLGNFYEHAMAVKDGKTYKDIALKNGIAADKVEVAEALVSKAKSSWTGLRLMRSLTRGTAITYLDPVGDGADESAGLT